jgi:hypothetical protein
MLGPERNPSLDHLEEMAFHPTVAGGRKGLLENEDENDRCAFVTGGSSLRLAPPPAA